MPAPDLRPVIAAPHPDVAPLPPAAPVGDGVRLYRGVPYAEVPGARPLELDLWLPAGTGPHPLVLLVHGGAWRRGHRGDMGLRMRSWEPSPFARIAASGFAVASADYRLSGEAVFPAQLDDLRGACDWLSARSDELTLDTERTVVWGESAGGHLAALLALADDVRGIVGAVVWYAPTDLTLNADNPHSPEALLLGAAPSEVPDRAVLAGPLQQVRPGAPPFFLAHGENDSMVGPEHATRLAARLSEVGTPVDLRLVPGADHVWYGLPEDQVEEVFAASLRWAHERAGG
ncbi:alpha/beta hydrolase fold domain-containing protein [Streptomyces sp. NPDC005548]|uniref:alpha/beta hydrolase fold domain-containing protein n=1 Tax=Streptomyces sp. NPDC005548 TaxID=3364724 RepID=UPI0036CF7719